MVFSVGSKVRLIHTGDEGIVDDWLEHDLIAVRLPDGEVIPVPPEAIERIQSIEPPKVKAKFVPGKKKPEALPLVPLPTDSQYTVLRPKGLQLAFDMVPRPDGLPDYYRMYLINDTQHNFLYQLALRLKEMNVWSTQGRLGPRTMIEAGALRYTELNANPHVDITNWRLLPNGKGTGRQLQRTLKLKPPQFFKKEVMAPYLNRKVYLYELFSSKEINEKKVSPQEKPSPPPLKQVTAQAAKQGRQRQQWNNLQSLPNEVWEKAMFKDSIDLHLGSLVEDAAAVPRKQILGVQLQHFEAYLQRAIQLGVERVFVIHGLGEGKLREAIHRKLTATPEVSEFRNEYHARFGYGATEVIFG